MLLWLQGGPGGTSMFGLFVEHGPYFVHKNLTCEYKCLYYIMLMEISMLFLCLLVKMVLGRIVLLEGIVLPNIFN